MINIGKITQDEVQPTIRLYNVNKYINTDTVI